MNEQTHDETVIREAQMILNRLASRIEGLMMISVDGIYGPRTAEAVRIFQNFVDMPVTGILDRETLARLYEADRALDLVNGQSGPIYPFERQLAGRTLNPGDELDLVTIIQLMLRTLGVAYEEFAALEATGVYDRVTEQAIRELQRINGLPQTGIVDIITWDRLARLYNKYVNSEGD